MDIINKIFEDKGLSDNSKKLYISNLRKLNNGLPIKNLNFLKDMNKCLSLVADYADNSKRSYIISACSVLKQMPKMKTKKSAAKRFQVRGSGSIKRGQAFKRHILTKKTTKTKRQLRGSAAVDKSNVASVKAMMPFA